MYSNESFPDHRRILSNELTKIEQLINTTGTTPILSSQLTVGNELCSLFLWFEFCTSVFLETGLPYIGFGFVDNFVMLVAVCPCLLSYLFESSLNIFRVRLLKHSLVQHFVFQRWQVGRIEGNEKEV